MAFPPLVSSTPPPLDNFGESDEDEFGDFTAGGIDGIYPSELTARGRRLCYVWSYSLIYTTIMITGLSVSSESPQKLTTPIQTPIASHNVTPRINGINESPVLDNRSKISETLKCGAIDDLLIVEKTEGNVSHVKLKDRTDNSRILENNFENASITERSVLDSPRNGESHNIEMTSNSVDRVCTRNVLAKENFVDTDVISSNNSSLADSVKTVSEQEGSSNGLEVNDGGDDDDEEEEEMEPASLDLEDPASTPDILQQLEDDFYNYEQFKDSSVEWNDTNDKKADVTILQTDYSNDKPNPVERDVANETGKSYALYGDNDACVEGTNDDETAIIHDDERTISSFLTLQEFNVDSNDDAFNQPSRDFSIEPKYIEMYDAISSNRRSSEKSSDKEILRDSFSFDFAFDDAVREESNLDRTSVDTHTDDTHVQKSSIESDASTFPSNFCDARNIVQSKENNYVVIETKNQIVQETDANGAIAEIPIPEKESCEEGARERHALENGFAPYDLDNSDFTEFMEHRDYDEVVSESTVNFDPVSDNDKCETVQIRESASSPDASCIRKLSSVEKASLPSTDTSHDCLKDRVNLTSAASEECATYKSESSVVYFSDGEFYDFDLRHIEPVPSAVQEDSRPERFENTQQHEDDDDFGDFTNFTSSAIVEWKHDEEAKVEPKEISIENYDDEDDDFGDFNDFETSAGVVETQQFSLRESICRIENKNVSLGMFVTRS